MKPMLLLMCRLRIGRTIQSRHHSMGNNWLRVISGPFSHSPSTRRRCSSRSSPSLSYLRSDGNEGGVAAK
jgi:hypothetical protein